ncbi:MAG: hypothetical protein II108_04645 [Clostridiales bacterium]|nr:hypothetical protein [Clostridiales bacterium]
MRIIRNTGSEILKLISTKVFLIVAILIIPFQALLAYVSGRQVLSCGLDAVPDESNHLLEAMPPLEYFGFDVIAFALIPLIVMGALFGAMEFKRHCLRTSLIYMGGRGRLFAAKSLAVTIVSFVLSFASVFTSIAVTHLAFGEQGLTVGIFNSEVWRFIMTSSLALTCLTLLSFAMGFIFRSSVPAMIFLIVQAYNVGNLLADKFALCKFLPVALCNSLIPSSPSAYTSSVAGSLGALVLWIALFLVLSIVIMEKRDIGGEY